MKKIVTALNNPELQKNIAKNKEIKIMGKDIQYKEGILEILEKNKNIDYIILDENLPGEIEIKILKEKIEEINDKIKIINKNKFEKLIKNNFIFPENKKIKNKYKKIKIGKLKNNKKKIVKKIIILKIAKKLQK